jgi:hypothetical protein
VHRLATRRVRTLNDGFDERLPKMNRLDRTGPFFLCLSLALLLCVPPAAAVLGGDATSVQADAAHLRAELRVTARQAYAVHELRTTSGVLVREYVSPAGKVFGVTWQGPVLPDMQQVLGTYFSRLANANPTRRPQGPVVINEPGLVLQSGGHMLAFTGKAYIPQMLPEGVRPDAIQ